MTSEDFDGGSLFEGMILFSPSDLSSSSPCLDLPLPPSSSSSSSLSLSTSSSSELPASPPPDVDVEEPARPRSPPSTSQSQSQSQPQPQPLDEDLFSDLTLQTLTQIQTIEEGKNPPPPPPKDIPTSQAPPCRQISRKKKKAVRIGYGRGGQQEEEKEKEKEKENEVVPTTTTTTGNSTEIPILATQDQQQRDEQIPTTRDLTPVTVTTTYNNDGDDSRENEEISAVSLPNINNIQQEDSKKEKQHPIGIGRVISWKEDAPLGSIEDKLKLVRARISKNLKQIQQTAETLSTEKKDLGRRRRKAAENVSIASARFKELERELEEACEAEDFETAERLSESLAAAEKEKNQLLGQLKDAELECDTVDLKMQELLNSQIVAEEQGVALLQQFAKVYHRCTFPTAD